MSGTWSGRLAAALLGACTASAAPERVLVAVAIHNEDPGNVHTPDFRTNAAAYAEFRDDLLRFADLMASNDLPWSLQSDWNFLLGVQQYEVAAPDTNLLARTAGTNVILYLARDRGVEMVPHSHEGYGYNFADVAWLLQQLGVEPAGVVGGHIYDPAQFSYQDWPRFINGIGCAHYTNGFVWKPYLLMGSGTPLHVAEPVATGLWRPASSNAYFTDQPTNTLACFGVWQATTQDLARLLRDVETARLPTGRLYTAAWVFPHHGLTNDSYFLTNVAASVAHLRAQANAGRLEVVRFDEAYRIWQDEYGGAGSVRRDDGTTNVFVTFSLNTQDFSYPALSADLLDRAVTLHETWNVPVDVFLTTWMVDLYASEYPALFARLATSRVVALSYHTRPPLPYRTSYDWMGLSGLPATSAYAVIMGYENHGLILTNGQPNAQAGGSGKLETLTGHAPWMVGAESDAGLSNIVVSVFRDQGVRFAVSHLGAASLGQQREGLYTRPEHFDLKLFEWTGTPVRVIFTSAVAGARSAAGAALPFVGVKMHDNDFFATSSAWMTVYLPKKTPPRNTNRQAVLLSAAEATNFWQLYESAVTFVASNRLDYTPVHAPLLLNLEGEGILLSTNVCPEHSGTGVVAGALSLLTSNTAPVSTWSLVAGPGDADNALFQLTGSNLVVAVDLDRETRSARRVRVRAVDVIGRPYEQALLVVAGNRTDDDDDGDGFSEAAERIAGTDPADAGSVLQWDDAARPDATWPLAWQAVSGRTYRVDVSASPDGPWSEVAGGPWTATSSVQQVQVGTATNPVRCARVRVE